MTQFYIDGKWVELDELVEKAEKYDDLIATKDYIVHVNRCIKAKKKLEAVKLWQINQLTDPDLSSNIENTINELGEILGGSEFTTKGDNE